MTCDKNRANMKLKKQSKWWLTQQKSSNIRTPGMRDTTEVTWFVWSCYSKPEYFTVMLIFRHKICYNLNSKATAPLHHLAQSFEYIPLTGCGLESTLSLQELIYRNMVSKCDSGPGEPSLTPSFTNSRHKLMWGQIEKCLGPLMGVVAFLGIQWAYGLGGEVRYTQTGPRTHPPYSVDRDSL